MLNELSKAINNINTSKLFAGIVMLILNIISKYVVIQLSKTQEEAIRNSVGRELLIFLMVFTGTRDIILSILLTAAFVILADHLFNEESKYCVIPKRFWKYIDTDNDGVISPEEEKRAMEILEKAHVQKQSKFNAFNY